MNTIEETIHKITQEKETLSLFRGPFHIIWNNGVWKIFNTWDFRDCEIFPSLDLAKKALHA